MSQRFLWSENLVCITKWPNTYYLLAQKVREKVKSTDFKETWKLHHANFSAFPGPQGLLWPRPSNRYVPPVSFHSNKGAVRITENKVTGSEDLKGKACEDNKDHCSYMTRKNALFTTCPQGPMNRHWLSGPHRRVQRPPGPANC